MNEQILIRYLGLGWIDAHHPWSQAGRCFKPDECFNHLTNVAIPLASELDMPFEPPATLPQSPDLPVIWMKASIDLKNGSCYADKVM